MWYFWRERLILWRKQMRGRIKPRKEPCFLEKFNCNILRRNMHLHLYRNVYIDLFKHLSCDKPVVTENNHGWGEWPVHLNSLGTNLVYQSSAEIYLSFSKENWMCNDGKKTVKKDMHYHILSAFIVYFI